MGRRPQGRRQGPARLGPREEDRVLRPARDARLGRGRDLRPVHLHPLGPPPHLPRGGLRLRRGPQGRAGEPDRRPQGRRRRRQGQQPARRRRAPLRRRRPRPHRQGGRRRPGDVRAVAGLPRRQPAGPRRDLREDPRPVPEPVPRADQGDPPDRVPRHRVQPAQGLAGQVHDRVHQFPRRERLLRGPGLHAQALADRAEPEGARPALDRQEQALQEVRQAPERPDHAAPA